MPRLSQVSLIFACGTALLSDGYSNSVIGNAVLVIQRQYGNVISENASTILRSLTFAGTVLGMLIFGYMSDKIGRKFGMVSIVSRD